MDRKSIQEQRMKGYFIEAAKKVVKEEGLSNLTVKKVADLAGYAPGTLYNYFADLNNLLLHCAVEFWDECKDYVLRKTENCTEVREKIIALTKAYTEYFVENTNIFQLIFLEEVGDVPEGLRERVYFPEVALVLKEALRECAEEGLFPKEKVTIVENLIVSSINGILLSFIKQRSMMIKDEIMMMIEEEVTYLL